MSFLIPAKRRGVFQIAHLCIKYLIMWSLRSTRTLERRAMHTLHPQQTPYWCHGRNGGVALARQLTSVSTRQLTHSQHVSIRHECRVFGYVIKCHLYRVSALCRSKSSWRRRVTLDNCKTAADEVGHHSPCRSECTAEKGVMHWSILKEVRNWGHKLEFCSDCRKLI